MIVSERGAITPFTNLKVETDQVFRAWISDNEEEFYETFQKPDGPFFNDHSDDIVGGGSANNCSGPGPGTKPRPRWNFRQPEQ